MHVTGSTQVSVNSTLDVTDWTGASHRPTVTKRAPGSEAGGPSDGQRQRGSEVIEGKTRRGGDKMQEAGRQERLSQSEHAVGLVHYCITGGGVDGRTGVYRKDEKGELRK